MTLDPFTLAGIAGTALIIVAYFGNQQGWLKSDDWPFPLANLLGSLMIMLSLVTAWNSDGIASTSARSSVFVVTGRPVSSARSPVVTPTDAAWDTATARYSRFAAPIG